MLTEEEVFEIDILELGMESAALSIPTDWRERTHALFAPYIWNEFSLPHVELWEWADETDIDLAPTPFVGIWPRGRGKSTNAELVTADWGVRKVRQYIGYVSGVQSQADKHVGTIAEILESSNVALYAPEMGRPKVGRNGSRSWNRTIVRTGTGFTVEAIGLNKAIRGGKIGWARFDGFIFDDVDDKHDTAEAVKKKEEVITTSILPAGATNCAVLFVQNLIHPDSIAHRLSKRPGQEGAADYLTNRFISGPFPAVEGLRYEFRENGDELRWHITNGRSLWQGWEIEDCEAEINREGPTAFELESQHAIDTDNPNALLTSELIHATRVSSHPDLIRAAVAVDPSGGAGGCGIVGGGIARIGHTLHGYTLLDYTTPVGTSSLKWAEAVLRAYHAIGADAIFVERNFGGDMVKNTVRTAVLYDGSGNVLVRGASVAIIEVTASRGKEVRAEPVATLFELGRWHHVGHFPELQKQWTRWQPGDKPSPNNLDAEVWLATGLLPSGSGSRMTTQPEERSRFAEVQPQVNGGSRWNKF